MRPRHGRKLISWVLTLALILSLFSFGGISALADTEETVVPAEEETVAAAEETVAAADEGELTALDTSLLDGKVTYGSKTDETYGTYTYVNVSGLTPYVFMPTGAGSATSSDFTNVTGMMGTYGEENDIVVAINSGIFYNAGSATQYCFNYKEPDGVVICNGVVMKSTESIDHTDCDILVVDEAGNVGWTDYYVDADALAAGTAYYYNVYGNKVIQSETENSRIVSAVTGFVPILINSTVVYNALDTSLYGYHNFVGHYTSAATRQIFGVKADGTYGILTNTTNWTLETAAKAAKAEGFVFAYNFDGGGSAETVIGDDSSGTYKVNTIFAQAKGIRPLPTYLVFTADNAAPQSTVTDSESLSAVAKSAILTGTTLADITQNITVTESFENANGNTSARILYSKQGVDTTKTLTHYVVDKAGTVRKTSTSPNGTLYYTKTAAETTTCLNSNNNTYQDAKYYDYSTGYTLSTADDLTTAGTKTVTVSYGDLTADVQVTMIDQPEHIGAVVSSGATFPIRTVNTNLNDIKKSLTVTAYSSAEDTTGTVLGDGDYTLSTAADMSAAGTVTLTVGAFGVSTTVDVTVAAFEGFADDYSPTVSGTNISFVSDKTSAMMLTTNTTGFSPATNAASGIFYAPTIPTGAASITVTPKDGYSVELLLLRASSSSNYVVYDSGWETTLTSAKTTGYSKVPAYYTVAVKTTDGSDISDKTGPYCYVSYGSSNGSNVIYGTMTNSTSTYTYVNVSGLKPYVFMPTGAGSATSSDFSTVTGMMNAYGNDTSAANNDILVAINAGIFYNAGSAKQYCFNYKEADGVVIANGVVLKSTESLDHTQCDILVIDEDGSVGWTDYYADADALAAGTGYYYDIHGDKVEGKKIVSAVTGFVPIVINGKDVYNSEDALLSGYHNYVGHYSSAAARQIFGVKSDGSYGILTNSAKNTNGWTMEQAAQTALAEGFVFAYNFDGGGSTETVLGVEGTDTYTVNTICPQSKGDRPLPTYIVFTSGNTAPASASAQSVSASVSSVGTVSTATTLADLTKYLTVTESFTNANGNTSTRTLYSIQGVDTSKTLSHSVVDKNGTVRIPASISPNGTLYYTKTASETATCLTSNSNTRGDGKYYDYSTGYTLSGDLSTAGTRTVTVSYGTLSTDIQVDVTAAADHIGAAVQTTGEGPRPSAYTFPVRADNTDLDDIKEKLTVTAYTSAEDTTGTVLDAGDYVLSTADDMTEAGTVTMTVDYGGVTTSVSVTLVVSEGYVNGYAPSIATQTFGPMTFKSISVVSDAKTAMLMTNAPSGYNPTANAAKGTAASFMYYIPIIPDNTSSITVSSKEGYSAEVVLLQNNSMSPVLYDSDWSTSEISVNLSSYAGAKYYTVAVKAADGSDISGDASSHVVVSIVKKIGSSVTYGIKNDTAYGNYTYVDVSGLTPYVFMPTGAGSATSSDFTNVTGMMNTYGDDTSEADNDILVAINAGIFYNAGTATQYCFNYKEADGVVISNGVVLKSTESIDHTQCDILVIDEDGHVGWTDYYADADKLAAGTGYYYGTDGQKVEGKKIISAVTGFVPIVINGLNVYNSEEALLSGYHNFVGHYTQAAVRQIFGVKSDGSYGILTNSTNWTLDQAAQAAVAEGFVFAYNLDGGGSAETVVGYDDEGAYTVDAIVAQSRGFRSLPTYIVFTAKNAAPVSATASSISAEINGDNTYKRGVTLSDLVGDLTVTESLTNANGNTSTRTLFSIQGVDTTKTLTHAVVDKDGTVRISGSVSPNGTLYYTKSAANMVNATTDEITRCLSSNNNTRQDQKYYDYSTGYTLSTSDSLDSPGIKTITVSYVPGSGLKAIETTFIINIRSSSSPSTTTTGSVGSEAPAEEETPFDDVDEDAWYYSYVKEAYEKGYMQGTSETEFDPDGQMTRAMVITVLYRLAGEPDVEGTSTDTTLTQDWYKDAVNWAYGEKIAMGTGDNTFGPDLSITREQLVVFLYRYAQAKGMDTAKYASGTKATGYDDWQSVDAYAQDAMKWAIEAGVIDGMTDSEIQPQNTATRAQFAAILARFDSLS